MINSHGTLRLVLALSCLGPSVSVPWAVAAQNPADRELLNRADQSIGRVDSIPAPDLAEDKVSQDMLTGLAELDAFVTRNDRRSMERALERFARASVRRPEWGWPDYAFAHAFLLLHDTQSPTIASAGSRLGEPHIDAMWRHLTLALSHDLDLEPARTMLGDLLSEMADRVLPTMLTDLLRTEVTRSDARASALVAWARYQRGLGQPDLALTIQRAALDAGADPSVVAIDRAYALATLGRIPEAVAAYQEGLIHLGPSGRDRYTQDLGWTVPPDFFDHYDTLDDSSAAEAITQYWGGPRGRLESHLAAWAMAHDRYRIPTPWARPRLGWIDHAFDHLHHSCGGEVLAIEEARPIGLIPLPGDVRHAEPLLDVRGALLLQHGVPALWIGRGVTSDSSNVSSPNPSILTDALQGMVWSSASEAWVYRIPGGFRLYALRAEEPRPLGAQVIDWDVGRVWSAVQPMVEGGAACPAATSQPAMSGPTMNEVR